MVPSAAAGLLAPNVMLHWPRLGELSCQRPARLTGGAPACGCAVVAGDELDPGQSMPLQPVSASSTRIGADARNAGRGSCMRCGYFIVGMTNSAPSLVPDGQRAVTVLVL